MNTDLPRLLSLVERRVTARLATALETVGGTVEEWRVLSLLTDGRGHPMTEIAEYALLPGPTLTKVTDRMVSAGLVHRRSDEVDRRRVLAFATDRGVLFHRRMVEAVAGSLAELERAAGAEEAALLHALLDRLSGKLPV